MKVLLISTAILPVPCLGYGGLEEIVANLAVALKSMGHKVSVLAVDGSELPHGIEFINGGIPGRVDERMMYELVRPRIDAGEFDIVHDHSWTKQIYVHKMQNDKIKFISTLHGMNCYRSAPPIPFRNMVCLSSDHALGTSTALNIDTKWCFNGIDTDKYVYNDQKSDRYLWLGRFMPGKGAHIAIEAAKKRNVGLDLVGDDTMVVEQDYVQQVKSMCDGTQIKYWGPQSRAKCAEFFGRAKAFLQCGNGTWREPYGLTTLESLSCGTPVIALRNGATVEILENYYKKHNDSIGILCYDANQLTNALESEELKKISYKSCRKYAESMDRREMAKNYLNLYGDVLGGKEW